MNTAALILIGILIAWLIINEARLYSRKQAIKIRNLSIRLSCETNLKQESIIDNLMIDNNKLVREKHIMANELIESNRKVSALLFKVRNIKRGKS